MRKILVLMVSLFACSVSFGNVRLPKIFSDHMVLQRNKPIPVWGWAEANEVVTVEFNNQSKSVTADNAGKWMIRLNPEKEGGPFKLVVKAKNKITIKDVLVGEVWICSGQSNMEFEVKYVRDSDMEIEEAGYPQIRHFIVPREIAATPHDDVTEGKWDVCSPETVGIFTAVGYFFARELYNELKIPVGLINSSWGGTVAETWISKNSLERADDYKEIEAKMPALTLDSLVEAKKKVAEREMTVLTGKIEAMQGKIGNFDDIDQWKDPDYNDRSWPHMTLPGAWEKQRMGLERLDGSVWFRKVFTIGKGNEGKAAKVYLSTIDDYDQTYLNGQLIGATEMWNEKRIYNVPEKMLKKGKNVITVRVVDGGGGGGFYGDAADMKVQVSRTTISLAGEWSFRVDSLSAKVTGVGPNDFPSLLFNGMINPLIPFAMQGVIWYQGESNADRAWQYRQTFPLLINDWRNHWAGGDFPFCFVQLASYNEAGGNSKIGSTWAELREAQLMTLSLPKTGMAVTTDVGESADIHPKNKQDVGKRLAAIALNMVYEKNTPFSGPRFVSMSVESNKAILKFTTSGKGLVAKDKYGYLKGFEVAGADNEFHFAKAFIDGDKVIVFSDSVAQPVAVRYGWADDASEDNLYDSNGFPAGPFRTDQWKGITEEERYTVGL